MSESMKHFLTVITQIGDSAVMTALVALMALYLVWAGSRKSAGIIVLSLLAAAGAIFILKLAFLGCWVSMPFFDLRSPSGHAALSAAVLGSFAALLSTQLSGKDQWIPYLVLIPLILLIAASRVLLDAHSPEEAFMGLFVGLCIAGASLFILKHSDVPKLDLRMLVIVGILVLVVFHGGIVNVEGYVRKISSWMSNC